MIELQSAIERRMIATVVYRSGEFNVENVPGRISLATIKQEVINLMNEALQAGVTQEELGLIEANAWASASELLAPPNNTTLN